MQTKTEPAVPEVAFLPVSPASPDRRRLWTRHPFRGTLRMLDPSSRQLKGIGWLINMSGGGVGFCAALDMPVYRFLILEFELDRDFLRIPVCIMQRSSDTMYGAEFLLLPDAARNRIDHFLARHAEAPGSATLDD